MNEKIKMNNKSFPTPKYMLTGNNNDNKNKYLFEKAVLHLTK